VSPPRVIARRLSGGYAPGAVAIEGVELEVAAGTSVAVLGPNGGGKTTFLRALLDDLPWRRGEVRVEGAAAYVPQTERPRLDFPIDALGVALMGRYPRLPWYRRLGAGDRRAARAALERVGLAAQERTPFGALSGGQRQRVLIARALTQEAEVLLLDEPLSAVDQAAAERIAALLDELRGEGRIVIVSTHDLDHARRHDRVLCLNRTQIAWGDPARTLTPDVLARTYGAELVRLDERTGAIVVQHHRHA
jgi:ABC-type Mn2+/Zn2+ transport system ATPase subunit